MTPWPRRRPRKAIFPVAGFGARFLPATKACPKELLPVVDRPLIEYAVAEAAAAGIRDMIFVTGRNKRAIEDHFDKAYELEHELTARANAEALRVLGTIVPEGVRFSYVRQPVTAGIGDALLRARPLAVDQPFAVLLPDDLIDGDRPALSELLDVFDQEGGSVVGVEATVKPQARHAGAVMIDEVDGSIRRVLPPGTAQGGGLALVGRFVFTPAMWDALASATVDGRDTSIADGIAALLHHETVYTSELTGRRYDCGTKVGFLEAQIAYARKRPELWGELQGSVQALVEPDLAPAAVGRSARTRAGMTTQR
jgi:UTP--glucose-1-phosphate uridylyltransferase